MRRFILLCVAGLIPAGCSPPAPEAPGGITVITGGTSVIINGPTPGASPSPGGSGELPAGSSVRVGMFGQSCPAGTVTPPNASRQIRPGCTASITATPKAIDGTDLPAAIHGPNIAWSIPAGGGVVVCRADSEAFNRTCRCDGLGGFTLAAQVKNVIGMADFECVS